MNTKYRSGDFRWQPIKLLDGVNVDIKDLGMMRKFGRLIQRGMKKLLLIFTLIPALCSAQVSINNNTVSVDAAGTLSNVAGIKTHTRSVSTSQTLLKTDCVVLASGDITLTAPSNGDIVTVQSVNRYIDSK